jgi:hypothetical protein
MIITYDVEYRGPTTIEAVETQETAKRKRNYLYNTLKFLIKASLNIA